MLHDLGSARDSAPCPTFGDLGGDGWNPQTAMHEETMTTAVTMREIENVRFAAKLLVYCCIALIGAIVTISCLRCSLET